MALHQLFVDAQLDYTVEIKKKKIVTASKTAASNNPMVAATPASEA